MFAQKRALFAWFVLFVAGAAILGGVSGQSCGNTDNVTWYDRYPARPPIEVRPGSGLSASEPIEAEVGRDVAMTVYIQGGQPPYAVTFDFKDGTEPEITTALMDPTQTWQPVAACTHKFAKSGQFVVTVGVRDAFERGAFADIYVRVTGEAPITQEPIDLSPFKSCTISVMVRGHFREPPTYASQGTAEREYDYIFSDVWWGTSSFSGNTFTATWENRVDPRLGTAETGELHVTVDPVTCEVISFSASRTETQGSGGTVTQVKKSSVSSSGNGSIPMVGYLPAPEFTPYLLCSVDGNEVCDDVGPAITYRADRYPDEWFTPVPWTLLTGYDCGELDHVWPEITIEFEAE